MTQPLLSIVIPCLNEGQRLYEQLATLQSLRKQDVEIIVVDGGSTALNTATVSSLCDQLVISAPGRSLQMNCGADASKGSNLLFLHADTLLPSNAAPLIEQALSHAHWGRFDVRLDQPDWRFKIIAWCINQRSRLSQVATGDQCLFFRADFFKHIGGFPEIPLMEDVAISKKARQYGRHIALHDKVTTSARRWKNHGTLKTILLMWELRLRYFLGESTERLHKRYYG